MILYLYNIPVNVGENLTNHIGCNDTIDSMD